ncbi:MAG TPA: hypothetical protein VGB08_00465 [Allosphingosinicella sp.]|jgi:hypothetical protein
MATKRSDGAQVPGDVSLLRLYVLRALYAFIVVGLALVIWPTLLGHRADWPLMNSVVSAMLGGVSLLALIGIFQPLRMLPLLLFELVWKALWLLLVGLPLWSAGAIDPRTMATVVDCLVGVVLVPIAMPWGYFFRRYLRGPGERWR